MGSIPGPGRSPGGGHGNPLQYSCLENPMDRGAWRATVHGVTQSHTRQKRLSTHAHVRFKRSSGLRILRWKEMLQLIFWTTWSSNCASHQYIQFFRSKINISSQDKILGTLETTVGIFTIKNLGTVYLDAINLLTNLLYGSVKHKLGSSSRSVEDF